MAEIPSALLATLKGVYMVYNFASQLEKAGKERQRFVREMSEAELQLARLRRVRIELQRKGRKDHLAEVLRTERSLWLALMDIDNNILASRTILDKFDQKKRDKKRNQRKAESITDNIKWVLQQKETQDCYPIFRRCTQEVGQIISQNEMSEMMALLEKMHRAHIPTSDKDASVDDFKRMARK